VGIAKVKLSVCLIKKALYHEDIWEREGIAPPFLTSTPDGGERSTARPGRFIPREEPPVPTG
jgi:hypothetical protein